MARAVCRVEGITAGPAGTALIARAGSLPGVAVALGSRCSCLQLSAKAGAIVGSLGIGALTAEQYKECSTQKSAGPLQETAALRVVRKIPGKFVEKPIGHLSNPFYVFVLKPDDLFKSVKCFREVADRQEYAIAGAIPWRFSIWLLRMRDPSPTIASNSL